MHISIDDIEQQDKRYRTSFVNSLAGFRQAVLVGTIGANEIPNLAIFNSLIHLGANPALFGLISRPNKVPKDTLQNILETKYYTLNYISNNYYKQAHQTSARYQSNVSEFGEVGLTPIFNSPFPAPFVQEAVVKIGMKLEQTIEIELNGTILIIGSIQQVEIPQEIVSPDGFVKLTEQDILVSCGLDAYFKTEQIGRLTYAKPGVLPNEIV